MISLRVFDPFVQPWVKSAPTPVLDQAYRWACQQFTRRSKCWQIENTIVTAVDASGNGIKVYTLPTTDYDISELRTVFVNKIKADIIEPEDGKHRIDNNCTDHWCFLDADNVTLNISPAPIEAGQPIFYRFVAATKLQATAAQIPDMLADLYTHEISEGAKYRLFSMPSQDWTDEVEAAKAFASFNNGIHRVGLRVGRGHSRTKRRVRGRFY